MSDLTITKRDDRGVIVVDLAGKIALGETSQQLHTELKSLVEAGKKNILLNLGGVEYIDSAGLGEMASAYITVTNLGGKIKLANTRHRLNSMLHVTKLYTLLTTYSDESEALESF